MSRLGMIPKLLLAFLATVTFSHFASGRWHQAGNADLAVIDLVIAVTAAMGGASILLRIIRSIRRARRRRAESEANVAEFVKWVNS